MSMDFFTLTTQLCTMLWDYKVTLADLDKMMGLVHKRNLLFLEVYGAKGTVNATPS